MVPVDTEAGSQPPHRNGNSGGVGEWLKPPGCKLGALTGYAGSNPAPATRDERQVQGGNRTGVRQGSRHRCRLAHVAQLEEHVLGKNGVTGSNPVVGSTYGTLDEARVKSE